MADETANQPDYQARVLTVALELLRRQLRDSVAFLFANRERKDPAAWAMSAMQRPEPAPEPKLSVPRADDSPPIPLRTPAKVTSPAPEPETPYRVGEPSLPPIPQAADPTPMSGGQTPALNATPSPGTYSLAPQPPQILSAPISDGFGLTPPSKDTSTTPAFDRPQSVIIVGPRPLPVSLEGAFKQAATTPRADRDGKEGGGLGMVKAMARQFAAVLGPLYALSTILGQTNSGMGVFQKSVNVLGSVLAPVVLPAFVMLAAGILAVSDVLWAKLLPALGKFYEWALKFGLPAVEDRVDAADRATDAPSTIRDLFKAVATGSASDVSAEMKKDPLKKADSLSGLLRQIDPTGVYGTAERTIGKPSELFQFFNSGSGKATGGKSEEKNADGSPKIPVGQRVSDAMRDVIKSLGMSMGPKGSISSLTGARDAAQLAAANVDPIEVRQLKVMQDTLAVLQNEFSKLNKPTPNDPQFRRG